MTSFVLTAGGGRVGLTLAASVVAASLLSGCVAANTADTCRIVPVAEVPVRLVRRLPIIDVLVNGKPARFVFDTGANVITISQAGVERLGLRYENGLSGSSVGIGEATPTRFTEPAQIAIAGRAVKPLRMSVLSKMAMLEPLNRVDGLLGIEAINGFDVDIDIPHRRIGLNEPRRCPEGPPPFAGPVDTFKLLPSPHGFAVVPITVDGRTIDVVADTGATTTYLNQAPLGLSEADLATDRAVLGRTSGPASKQVRVHQFHSVRIGGAVFEDVGYSVGPLPANGGGLLGGDFWRHRRAWLSFAGGAMTVQRSSDRVGQGQ